MRGSLHFACTLSLEQKTTSQWNPFHFDFYNDHSAETRRVKAIGRCFWPRRSSRKVNTVRTVHQTTTNLMTPGQYCTMHQVSIPKEPITTQSASPVEQNSASGTKFKQTAVVPESLSADGNVLCPQVSTQGRISPEKKNTPDEHNVAKDSLPSSCDVNPANTPGLSEVKEICGRKNQKFLIAGEDSLLYDEVLDDEASSDLDSSLEGKLLVIDESLTDEEIDNDGTKEIETETLKPEVRTVPQIDEPASSSTPHKAINQDLETLKLETSTVPRIVKPSSSSTPDKDVETVNFATSTVPQNDEPASSSTTHKKVNPDLGTVKLEASKVPQMDKPVYSSTGYEEVNEGLETVELRVPTHPQIDKPAPSSTAHEEVNEYLERTDTALDTEPPKLSRQESLKDLKMPEKINSSHVEGSKVGATTEMNVKDDISEESPTKTITEIPDLSSTELCEMQQDQKIGKEPLKANTQPLKQGNTNLDEFVSQSEKVVFKQALKNLSGVFDGSADTPRKVVAKKDDPKDKTTEQASETECSDQSVLNESAPESCGTPVQPSASPDSTTSTGEELSPKLVPCRKVSFVLIEDWYVCLSCSKRFMTTSLFERHVWGHFHRRVSRTQLCIHCPPNQYFPQCPAVNKVFTMLQNSCSKEVSSLRLNLLLDIPPKDKKATDTNQVTLAENPVTNNHTPMTKLMPTPLEKQTSERTNFPVKGRSQNLEYLTIFIASQQFVCTNCRQRIEPSHLAHHIYHHLHTSTNLPEHGICISDKECDIMRKIVPLIPSPEVRKASFHLLDISWKWNIHRDLKYQIMLIRHNPKNGSSRNSGSCLFTSSKEDMQVVKASNFLIPNQTKGNPVPVENDANTEDVVIGEKESVRNDSVSDDNVIILDSYPGKKVTPPPVRTQERGYKKMTFVIRGNNHICTSCMKGYVNLDLLKAHIMWHFHSNEKLCSISHYDGQQSQEKECPILTNIMSCIPKDPGRDKEFKKVIVYWKKNSEERTAFKVQILYPKKSPVIDLTSSDDDVAAKSEQSGKDSLEEGIVIDIKHSLEPQPGQNELTSQCLEPNKYQGNSWEERKVKVPPETMKPEPQNIPLATTNGQVSQSCESVKSESYSNSSLKSEGGFYICGFQGCRFSCIESKQFLEHLEELHASEETFPCVHCGYGAKGQDLLMKHMDSHANHTLFLLYRCSMCEYASNLLPDFEQHLRSCHSENGRYMCCSCKESFRVIDLLLKHLTKNLLKFILCPHCSARDIYRRRMLNHIKAQHPDKPRQIVVSSQIICKMINQNKLMEKSPKLKETLTRKPKSKENVVIVLDDDDDDDDEDGDTSRDGNRVQEKDRTTMESKDTPQVLATDKETKSANHLGLLVNLLNKVEKKPKPHLDWSSLIGDSVKSDVDSKSKNEKPSPKHRDENIIEKETDNTIVLGDSENNTIKNVNNNVECNNNEGVVQIRKPKYLSPILTKMLSNPETRRLSSDDNPKSVEKSSEVETEVQKSKSFLEKKGVEEETKKMSTKEHYTVKDISKLPCELKVRLRRLSCSKELSDMKDMSPNQASGKERNVFQLFRDMENADVQRSPQIAGSSGSEAQIAGSSGSEAQLSGSSGSEAQLSGSSGSEAQLSGSSGREAQLSGLSGREAQLSGLSGREAQLSGSSGSEAQLSGLSGSKAQIQESSGDEAQVMSAQSKDSSKDNNSGREDSVENDCTDTEDFLDQKIKTPSLLQEVSLGGASLDLRLQKCYSKSGQHDQDKQLVCDVCQEAFKTVYRMHLHLLSDHLEWPLWECQDCGRRAYSHSKITSHCWRHHKNQFPRIKSLDLPVIDRKDNNIVVRNAQEEFTDPGVIPPLAGSGKKGPKSMISMPSKLKKGTSSAGPSPSTAETPKPSAKKPRKRSISSNSEEKEHKKRRKSSVNEGAPDTTDPNPSSSVGKSASIACLAPGVNPRRDCPDDGEQPPKKKSKTCDPDRNEKKCSMCNFSCSSKTNLDLLKHMIQEHMKEYQNFISEEDIEQVEDAITGTPLEGFICPFCGQNMEQRVGCKIHIWRAHAHLEYLHCSQCEFVTWFERHLQRHVAENHGESQTTGSSKDEKTPATGVNHSNRLPITLSTVTSSLDSQTQQEDPAKKTTGQKNQLCCSKCKYIALSKGDLKDHSKKQHSKKLVNGISKTKTSTKNPKTPPVSASPQKALSSQKNSKKKKKNPVVLLPLQNALPPEKSHKNKKKTPPLLLPQQELPSDESNKDKNQSPPELLPLQKSDKSNQGRKKKILPLQKASSSDKNNKDITLKKTPPRIIPLRKASCANVDKSSVKNPPTLFPIQPVSSSDESSNKDTTLSKRTRPVRKSNKKDKTPSKPPDECKTSSEKGPSKGSLESSDKNKNSNKNKIPKDKNASKKSTEMNKSTRILQKILPKPPTPSEKSLETKSSEPDPSPNKNGVVVGSEENAEESKTNSSSVYVTSICPKTGKKLYFCSICSALRYNMPDVLNHCKKHRDVLYSCSECPYKKHNRDRVFEHLKLEHRNKGRVLSTSGNSLKGRLKLEEEKKRRK